MGDIGLRIRRRSDALLASAGLVIGLIIFAALSAGIAWQWWRNERAAAQIASARAAIALEKIRPVLQAADPRGDLQGWGRRIHESASGAGVLRWSVVLPDGRVVASSDPTEVTAHEFPAQWPSVDESIPRPVDDSSGTARVEIAGGGPAWLVAQVADDHPPPWEDPGFLGAAVLGALGLLVWGLLCRRASARMAALVRVGDALRAEAAGGTAPGELQIDEAFGPEAAAWNTIIAEREAARRRDLEERAARVMQVSGAGEGASELGGLCDAMWIGLLIVDDQQRITYCNGAAATLLNAKREDIPGRSATECFTDEQVRELLVRAASGACRHRVMHERQVQAPGASASTLRISVKSLRKDDRGAAFIVMEDITQQKVAEESRHSFAAQVTHELRSPLTNMRLYVDTLLEDESGDPQLRAKCMNVVSTEIRRLERVVSDMLSVSEMEAGSITIRKDDVRLDALFEEIEADHRIPAHDKEITLRFDLPPKLPVIEADRDKVSMALHNLLGNAIKYTPAGGEVRVIVSEEAGRVAVVVKDNGIGIKPEESELIFEKFYRAKDKRLAGITGSGLGLAIARQVVRLHGGDITVSSEIDKGSTFTLTLPATRSAAAAPARAAA